MPRFPNEGRSAQGLSDRVYTRLLDRARASGRPIAPLHVGDTYREPLEAARAEAQATRTHPRLHNYAPVQGEPALREAASRYLARRHDVSIAPDAIQVLCGGTSGLNVLAQVLLDPGDELLLPSPYWPLIRGIVASRGATPVEIPFWTRVGGAGFDVERALEAAITERTVAVYVNSPNNPTGAALDDAGIEALAAVAERHALWVICDEAYEEIYFDGAAPRAVWKHPRISPRALVVHTASKSYGLAGSRVGFVHGPEPVMSAVRGVQTFLTYCAPRPLQLGVAHALDGGDAWLEASRQLYGAAARAAAKALDVPAPSAGTFLFFDAGRYLTEDATGSDAFLEACADEGVILTPGSVAGADYARWARLCFTAVPPDELDRALTVLAALASKHERR